jgi:hypothetical protein
MNNTLTIERLRHVLSYEPETGLFTWRRPRGRGIKEGDVAGSVDPGRGYRRIKVDYRIYLAHRLAWFYVHSEWPTVCLDHANGVCDDNRLTNLRPATMSENQQNRRTPGTNTSGFIGASFNKQRGNWTAQISVNGKRHRLGSFRTPEEAHQAYLMAKQSLHTFNPEVRQ